MEESAIRLIPVKACATAIILFFFESAAGAQPLTPPETRGKHIYFRGESPAGTPIAALVGKDDTELNGRLLPCANCHGKEGLGGTEGGLAPPDITWSHLTKPYGHVHAYGRTHPPFTDETLARAITQGLDSARNKLDAEMPRYRMSARDLGDLIAYLKRIEDDRDSGLSDGVIRVGVLVPADRKGERIRRTVTAYFQARNREGGYFGRNVEPVFLDGEKSGAELRTSIEKADLFALLGFASVRTQADLADIAEMLRIPVIEPSIELSDPERAVNPYTFYLLSGIGEQSQLLADYAARAIARRGAVFAVVRSPGTAASTLARRLVERIRRKNLEVVEPVEYAGTGIHVREMVGALRRRQVEAVIFLGSDGEFAEFCRSATEAAWVPWILLPGSLAGPSALDASPALRQRLLIGYPTLPRDRAPARIAEIAALAGDRRPAYPEIVAYVMAGLFDEGVRRAGRRLGRDRFMAALRNLNGHDTGLIPPISFGNGRQIGAAGAYIVSLDPKSPAQTTWVKIDERF